MMLIRNYGLFWRREDIAWGSRGPNGSGTLLGRYARKRKSPGVDFRQQRGVYVLYDDNFKIIYVGQAGAGNQRLFVRLRQHKSDHLAQRWSRVSWFGILPVVNGNLNVDAVLEVPTIAGILAHVEGVLLAAAEPPLNLQRGRFGQNVEQYVQHVAADDDGEDDDEDDDEDDED